MCRSFRSVSYPRAPMPLPPEPLAGCVALLAAGGAVVDSLPLVALKGAVLGWSVAAIPGPINMEMLRRGLKRGARAAFPLGVGASAGDFLWALVVTAGLGAVGSGATAQRWLGAVSAAVLLALGVRLLAASVRAFRRGSGATAGGAPGSGTGAATGSSADEEPGGATGDDRRRTTPGSDASVAVATGDAPSEAAAGTPPASPAAASPPPSTGATFLLGFTMAVTSPFNVAFWLGILGTSTAAGLGRGAAFVLALAVVVGALAWCITLCLAIRVGSRFTTPRWEACTEALAGGVMVWGGLRAALVAAG